MTLGSRKEAEPVLAELSRAFRPHTGDDAFGFARSGRVLREEQPGDPGDEALRKRAASYALARILSVMLRFHSDPKRTAPRRREAAKEKKRGKPALLGRLSFPKNRVVPAGTLLEFLRSCGGGTRRLS